MRVLLIGSGRPVAEGFARSLRLAGGYYIIGACGSESDRLVADADETHLFDVSDSASALASLAEKTGAEFIHAQTEPGVACLSRSRRLLRGRTFLPPEAHITACQDKWATYLIWKNAGVPVPKTVLGRSYPGDWPCMPVHVRPRWGGGGKDSLRKAGHDLAEEWLDNKTEPNMYTVAEHLDGGTVTWQAIYKQRSLQASQLRRRLAWTNGDHGSALISETFYDRDVEAVGVAAVQALGGGANGIYSVDMTLDAEGNPYLTEINAGRFFTTIDFFARCGKNMPDFFCRGAPAKDAINMCASLEGQRWIRSMDREPVLASA